MKEKKNVTDVVKSLDQIEISELDDTDLDSVAGGAEGCVNDNCQICSPGDPHSGQCTNGNCSGNEEIS